MIHWSVELYFHCTAFVAWCWTVLF